MDNMQKIDEGKVMKYGSYTHTFVLPSIYVSDNKINSGDLFMIFRTQVNGIDALILIPKIKEQQMENNNLKRETEA